MDRFDMLDEMGLTVERGLQLDRITQNIMDKFTEEDGYGRTSYVILSIVSRKDLSDLEKAVCIFIFCSKIRPGSDASDEKAEVPDMHRIIDMNRGPRTVRLDDKINTIDFNIGPMIGGHMADNSIIGNTEKGEPIVGISGRMLTPPGINPKELTYVTAAMLISLLGRIPKDDAKEFCRNMSMAFMKMAITGDMKL